MDILFKRFALVGKTVLNNLDDQSLTKSKEASKEISEFLDNGRFFWTRIIKKYNKNFEGFEESWKEVINKTPVDIVKQLAIAVPKFFESYSFKQVALLHIANGALVSYRHNFRICLFQS